MTRLLGFLIILIIGLNQLCIAKVDHLVIFGDSLSDGGNNGRYTDGRLWLEVLAERLGLKTPNPSKEGGYNFACSGAMSGDGNGCSEGEIIHVKQQIELYLEGNGGKADPGALYVIWIGGNDFLDGRNSMDLIENIISHVNTLMEAGAREFFIPNMPSLVQAPKGEAIVKTRVDSSLGEAFSGIKSYIYDIAGRYMNQVINNYNISLKNELLMLKLFNEYVNIYYLDVYSKINAILENLEDYGFRNKSELFFDSLHPNAKLHALIADSAFEILEIN